MALRKKFRGVSAGGRECRTEGCAAKVEAGHAYCRAHVGSPEAAAFRTELRAATTYFDMAVETLDPDQVERSEAFQRFRQRARRGEFERLLEKPTREILEQAARVAGLDLELGALRYGLMRVLAEETDPSRMALALARLANAAVRVSAAREGGRMKEEGGGDGRDELDRLAEAMVGYTLEGREFKYTPLGLATWMRVQEQEERWREAGRKVAELEAESAAMTARLDAADEAWRAGMGRE